MASTSSRGDAFPHASECMASHTSYASAHARDTNRNRVCVRALSDRCRCRRVLALACIRMTRAGGNTHFEPHPRPINMMSVCGCSRRARAGIMYIVRALCAFTCFATLNICKYSYYDKHYSTDTFAPLGRASALTKMLPTKMLHKHVRHLLNARVAGSEQ